MYAKRLVKILVNRLMLYTVSKGGNLLLCLSINYMKMKFKLRMSQFLGNPLIDHIRINLFITNVKNYILVFVNFQPLC